MLEEFELISCIFISVFILFSTCTSSCVGKLLIIDLTETVQTVVSHPAYE